MTKTSAVMSFFKTHTALVRRVIVSFIIIKWQNFCYQIFIQYLKSPALNAQVLRIITSIIRIVSKGHVSMYCVSENAMKQRGYRPVFKNSIFSTPTLWKYPMWHRTRSNISNLFYCNVYTCVRGIIIEYSHRMCCFY